MTLREHIEAIRDRHGATLANQDDFLTYSDAVAALAELDDAEIKDWDGANAWPAGLRWPADGRYSKTLNTVRLVPDPEPGA